MKELENLKAFEQLEDQELTYFQGGNKKVTGTINDDRPTRKVDQYQPPKKN